ncbi:MFS transporter [Siccirubricoccus deserti]
MSGATGAAAPVPKVAIGLLLACGVLVAAMAMGLRQTFGLFLAPMTAARDWGAADYSFAIALQVLINGVTQPLWGQLADRIGGRRVIMLGAALQAAGVLGMALTENLLVFTAFAGLVVGAAVSAAGMPVIMASLTRLLPERLRGRATGLGTAGSSFGQFLVVPLAHLAISGFGWQVALFIVAASALVMIPLALPLNDAPAPPAAGAVAEETARQALRRAFATPSFWFLFFGFYVCGLHVSFMGIHLPGFVASCHLPAAVGAGALSLIGLFNIVGSLTAGRFPGAGRGAGCWSSSMRRAAW